MRAAEIAFVDGATEQGMSLLTGAYHRLVPRAETRALTPIPRAFTDIVQAALLGVLLGIGSFSITPDLARLVDSDRDFIARVPSQTGPEHLAQTLPLALILASEQPTEFVTVKFLRSALERPDLLATVNAISGDPLFNLLGLLPGIYNDQSSKDRMFALNRRDGYAALRQLEREYGQRIGDLVRDQYHWRGLLFRSPLVDWGLVASQTILIRSGARKRREHNQTERLGALEFSWSLATMFSGRRL